MYTMGSGAAASLGGGWSTLCIVLLALVAMPACNRRAGVSAPPARTAILGTWNTFESDEALQLEFGANGILIISDEGERVARRMQYKWNTNSSLWIISSDPDHKLSIVMWVDVLDEHSMTLTMHPPGTTAKAMGSSTRLRLRKVR